MLNLYIYIYFLVYFVKEIYIKGVFMEIGIYCVLF